MSSLAFPRSLAWKVGVGEACDWSRLRRPVQSIVWTNLQGQGYLWDVKNLQILPTRVRLCLGCNNIGAYTYLLQTFRARAVSGAELVPTGASLCLSGKKRSICLRALGCFGDMDIYEYDSLSDVGKCRVWFASKNLTPCRMYLNAFLIAQIIVKCHSFPNM